MRRLLGILITTTVLYACATAPQRLPDNDLAPPPDYPTGPSIEQAARILGRYRFDVVPYRAVEVELPEPLQPYDRFAREVQARFGKASTDPGDPTERLLRVSVRLESAQSARNTYGRVHLEIQALLNGGEPAVATTRLIGPWRLSRISAADAAFASFAGIDDAVIEQVMGYLHGQWRSQVQQRGLEYRVSTPATGRELWWPVMRSVGTPVAATGSWYFFESPDQLARVLRRGLDETEYGVRIDPLLRNVEIFYSERN